MHENVQNKELAVLVGLDTGKEDIDASLSELEELTKTADAEVIGMITQKLGTPSSSTYVGSGKLEEITEFCENNDVDLLIFDDELSPTQIRNIEQATDIRTIDRSMLILDIFASRAKSSEGKLQVELAQMKYLMPRLTGKGIELSRQGGSGQSGIATRGPGETKLETDRRHIRRRIQSLREHLKNVEKQRIGLRQRRIKEGIPTVALVGYTNSGKSTLMNALTDAGVLAENKLFATLDPTARALLLPNGQKVLLIDTVGFIRKLPHHLIEAFKSTLEEAVFSSVILNICDIHDPEAPIHLKVTKDLLTELGCTDQPVITVFNKCDLLENNHQENDIEYDSDSVGISALHATGLDDLLNAIEKALPPTRKKLKFLFPFSMSGMVSKIRKNGTVLQEEYVDNGILIEAVIDVNFLSSVIHEVDSFIVN